ncbi:unnamed protein product [Durusdinium trenchii]|uniref:Uncharacterized protein n=1 Tax=Durusdinium trenchii TaxID=1381693 RepID=A0ABP0KE05_9DINO
MAHEVSLGVQLRAASTKLQNATAKRKALAQRAAHEVGVLLHRRKSLEAQRVEEEQRIAKAAAAKVAQEVAKFWRSCCRAAAYFEVQQRHKAKEKQHFDNIQALVSRSEAFSSEVTTQLFAQEEPGESGSDTSSDSGAGLSASPAPEALARAKKLRKPLTSSKADEVKEDSGNSKESENAAVAPARAASRERLEEEWTKSVEGPSENFDRRCMSKQITTKVPVLLLRHPIREYQHVGLHWLATLHDKNFNGILADEMGLGKTIMTIALLAHLAIEKEVWGPHLIVVPSSVLMNWVKELKKWTPGLKVCAYFGNAEERRWKRRGWGVSHADAFHICLVSYAVALQDVQPLKRQRWYYMILDEAQHIKNFRSQKWQQLMRFHTEHRLLLTGTPLQNNLTELWSLMHFLMPDMFQSYSDFKEFFSDRLQVALHEKRVDQDLVARLHKVLRPFMLRRLKSEVERQLPNKHEYVVRCPLSRRQQVLYEEFMQRRETQRVLKKGEYIGMMGVLMQLRKVCNHPELFEARGAVTPLVVPPLDVHLPSCVLLALWRSLAGRRPGEENFCSFLLPLLSLWRLELSLMQLCRKDLPLAEVIEVSLPAPKRRRVMPGSSPSGRRKHLSPQSQKFVDVSYLAHLAREERRREQREAAAVDVDQLLWMVSAGRPWIGSNGLQLLSPLAALRSPHRGRPFLWPEPRRPSTASRSHCWEGSVRAALENCIHRDLQRNFPSCLGRWAFRVPRVQVASLPAFPTELPSEAPPHVRLRLHLSRGQRPTMEQWHQSTGDACQALRSALGDPLTDALEAPLRCHLPEKQYLESDCGKLRALASMLHRFKERGDKCIIFTQFIKMLDVLENFVCHHRYIYVRLDGMVKVEMRQELVDRFNEDERIFLFICSTRAGGVGINLASANVVIFYDSDWNPAMDRQATDRAHRIGQTREVHIYRLISEHTVEENIWQRQLQKRELDHVVVDQGRFNMEKLKSLHQDSVSSAVWTAAEVRSLLDGTSVARRSSEEVEAVGIGREATEQCSDPLESAESMQKPEGEAAAAAEATSPKQHVKELRPSMTEFEQVLQRVEDAEDAQMAQAVSGELRTAEQLLKGEQQGETNKAPEKMEWLSLPRLVRWGIHRVRLLEVEEVLSQRRAQLGKSGKRKRMPNVA